MKSESVDLVEEQYRALVTSSHDHIFILNTDGYYISSNNRVRHFGLENGEDLTGKHVSEVYSKDVAEQYMREINRVATTEKAVSFEHSLENEESHVYHIDTLYPLKRRESLWAIGGICHDITAQKNLELALLESETKFRLLYEEAPLSYQSLDMNGKIVDVNKTWMDELGYDYSEAIGQPFTEFMAAERVKTFESRFEAFKKSGVVKDVVLELKRRDGNVLAAAFDGRIAKNPLNGELRTHCVFKDVTESREVELKLIESERELARKNAVLNEKNIALREILEQLKQDSQEKGMHVLKSAESLISPVLSKRLTPREVEICDLVRAGKTSKEIADALALSPRSVETHRTNIRKKLKIADRKINLAVYLRSL
jgi:PAS domain S-box-containing protein